MILASLPEIAPRRIDPSLASGRSPVKLAGLMTMPALGPDKETLDAWSAAGLALRANGIEGSCAAERDPAALKTCIPVV